MPMATTTEAKSHSAYKRAHLRYKRQGDDHNDVLLLLSECIDFCAAPKDNDNRVDVAHIPSDDDDQEEDDDASVYYSGRCFGLRSHPGFLYFPQALGENLQLELAYQSVSTFCESPHATNIELIPPKPHEAVVDNTDTNNTRSMWEHWKREHGQSPDPTTKSRPSKKRAHYRSFRKLSWATCGYQYDWTRRKYTEDAKSTMPSLLEDVATKFAKASLLLENNNKCNNEHSIAFTPSACICNYYNLKSTMGGHVDDLELARDKPVVSLNLGLPAIFLLGGKTKDDVPILPILVRPGDVLVLGGDCRMNVHGMARVLPPGLISEIIGSTTNDNKGQLRWDVSPAALSDREDLLRFLSEHRININVRQVLPDGMTSIPH